MIVVAAVLLVAALPAEASAQGIGEVGGPPTMGAPLRFPPPDKRTFFPRARSEAIVIGLGFNASGRVEIVGQDSKDGLCIFVEHVTGDNFSGRCGSMTLPKLIAVESVNWQTRGRRSRSITEFAGFMQPSVAGVRAVARVHKGHKVKSKAVSGITAVPGSDLLARLNQTAPFGYYAADFRGCLTDAKVRLHAFDPSGQQLGTRLTNLSFPHRFRPFDPCTPGSSSVGFVSPSSARTAVAG
jgi:hypothetical protein